MRYKENQIGFTLVELLIVVSLIVILTSFLIPSFSSYSESQNVIQAQEQIKSDLRSVQNNALASVGANNNYTHWVMFLNDNDTRYSYFRATGTHYNANCLNSTEERTYSPVLPRNTYIRNGPICVFFSFENGDITFNNSGNPSLGEVCDDSDPTNCTITIGSAGDENCISIEFNSAGLIKARSTELNCESAT